MPKRTESAELVASIGVVSSRRELEGNTILQQQFSDLFHAGDRVDLLRYYGPKLDLGLAMIFLFYLAHDEELAKIAPHLAVKDEKDEVVRYQTGFAIIERHTLFTLDEAASAMASQSPRTDECVSIAYFATARELQTLSKHRTVSCQRVELPDGSKPRVVLPKGKHASLGRVMFAALGGGHKWGAIQQAFPRAKWALGEVTDPRYVADSSWRLENLWMPWPRVWASTVDYNAPDYSHPSFKEGERVPSDVPSRPFIVLVLNLKNEAAPSSEQVRNMGVVYLERGHELRATAGEAPHPLVHKLKTADVGAICGSYEQLREALALPDLRASATNQTA